MNVECLVLYIQVITTNCFQELVPFKPTYMFSPTAPYGNEFHNIIFCEVDSYFLWDGLIWVPLFFSITRDNKWLFLSIRLHAAHDFRSLYQNSLNGLFSKLKFLCLYPSY